MTRDSPHALRTRLLGWLLAAIVAGTLAQAGLAYMTALAQSDVVFDRHMQKMAQALTSGTALAS
jgi:two-component system OmpR family sensor kinase